MDAETLFLLGVYLAPLGFVSLIGAWAHNRRPVLAIILLLASAAVIAFVALTREDGVFALRDIPDMTIALIARVIGNL